MARYRRRTGRYGAEVPDVCVLGNPEASPVAEVSERIAAAGYDVESPSTGSGDELTEAATRAVTAGAGRVIAVGGDGVVHHVAQALAETEVVLGVVAHGTGNDFARALGLLEGDLAQHVAAALAEPSPVDAIRTTHGWVCTVATLGFSGDVTDRANALRWPRGGSRYSLATLMQLPRLRTIPVSVTVDGDEFADATTLLSVGNTAYFGGGMRICPNASAIDGVLDVVNIGAVPRHRFVRVFPTVFSGRHVDRDEVECTTGESVVIGGSTEIDLWADGELLGPLPVTLEVVPQALRVAGVGQASDSSPH